MDKKIFLFLLIIVVAIVFLASNLNMFGQIKSESSKESKNKVIEVADSFVVEYPMEYIEAKIGDSFNIDFNIKIFKNTSVYFLTMIVPIGIECYVNTSTLHESGVVSANFRINEMVENEINKVWFVVKDDFENKKDIFITIKVVK